MVKATKPCRRHRTSTTPRSSPSKAQGKRQKHHGTLDGFLALATSDDDQSTGSRQSETPATTDTRSAPQQTTPTTIPMGQLVLDHQTGSESLPTMTQPHSETTHNTTNERPLNLHSQTTTNSYSTDVPPQPSSKLDSLPLELPSANPEATTTATTTTTQTSPLTTTEMPSTPTRNNRANYPATSDNTVQTQQINPSTGPELASTRPSQPHGTDQAHDIDKLTRTHLHGLPTSTPRLHTDSAQENGTIQRPLIQQQRMIPGGFRTDANDEVTTGPNTSQPAQSTGGIKSDTPLHPSMRPHPIAIEMHGKKVNKLERRNWQHKRQTRKFSKTAVPGTPC